EMARQLEAGQRNPALDAPTLRALEGEVQGYCELARSTSLAMIDRKPGMDLTASLERMTRSYNELKARLEALSTQQKTQMNEAFASTEATQRRYALFSGGITLALLLGLSAVVGRSQELAAKAHRESEERLWKSQKMLQEAQRTAHIGSWERDLVTNEIVWSEELYRIFGRDPESFQPSTKTFLDGVHPEDLGLVEAQIETSIRTGDPYHFVFRFVRQDGDVRSLLASGAVILDQTGRAVRVFGTLQDVTEQRRLEDQLRQSQKMEAVGRLAGGVAHDFNNLLTVIQGYADLLLSSGVDERKDRTEAIEQIRIASQRAAALTQQLLAFSRQQVLQPKALELNAVVSNLVPMLRRVIGEDIELVTNLDPRGESVLADAGQLEQVIMNLVVNSRDAMPQGGTLTIETGGADAADLPGVEPETPPGRYVRLTVKDTGTGLSPQVQARIFEPFFTTKEVGKGTGLGLATVYGIVKQSGGFVQLHSEPGHGATFNVYLPCTEGEIRRPEPASGLRRAIPSGKTILLIEDEEAVRKLLFSVLSGQGYTVLQAGSGQEALAVEAGHSGPIHLILSDVVMPGKGGPETVAELQRSRSTAQVIFMSGYTDDSVLRHGLTDSGRHFLQKPFNPVTLLKKVREVLAG
ncbi:MAG TPA: ATP-binding protein, partial [Thermoanaerobaculia bacterium]|nr:ATP-binding protein [Thermoanaerobaculia bacterium]